MNAPASAPGVTPLLRAEGAVFLLLAGTLYASLGYGWLLFAVLLLVPDLSMLGYLAGPRVGAAAYNLAHTYAAPALVGGLAWANGYTPGVAAAAIWGAHIGLDRMLGYGLKLPTSFKDTHLGTIGRR